MFLLSVFFVGTFKAYALNFEIMYQTHKTFLLISARIWIGLGNFFLINKALFPKTIDFRINLKSSINKNFVEFAWNLFKITIK